jgi:hypothetical protein
MEKLPVIYLTIDDDHDTGLDAISLVDHPAIERNWMAFNKKQKFALNEEKRIVSGMAMVSDYPIYKKDEDGREYYVVFDSDSIRKIAYKFMKEGKTNATNLDHETEVDGVFMFESFLIDDTSQHLKDSIKHPTEAGSLVTKLITMTFGRKLKTARLTASALRACSASPDKWTLTK